MSTLSHIAAGFSATAASLGTPFAMVKMASMFFAHSGTGLADLGANFTDVIRVCTATRHERDGGVADFGAVTVEPDAVHHHLYVLFAKAGFGAGITGSSASLAGLDAVLVLLGC